MGWTCRVAGMEPGVARARIMSTLIHPMARCLAPLLATTVFLAHMTPVYAGTSYHRFASGLSMNIRHLPCVSRRTGEAGTCMFAYSCAKLNGTHLGTCIDRFYFGSCCRLPPGVAVEDLSNVNSIDDGLNFIDDNNIASSEKPKPPQTNKPGRPSSSTLPNTVSQTTTTHSYISSHRPSPTTQRPLPPSVTYPSTLRPPTTQGVVPTKKYTSATSTRPTPSPTTPAPTLVTWTTIDGFPPRKPPAIVAPTLSTTHRTPTTRPPVTVNQSKPTSVFNITSSVIKATSPKPSSPLPTTSKPAVTIISTVKPTTPVRPSGASSKPVSTSRPSTVSTSRPSSVKPSGSSKPGSKPSSKPSVKPSRQPTKPPVKYTTSKPSISSKPVTSVTIISNPKPSSARPTKPSTTKPSRPASQKPQTSIKPSSVKPSTAKPAPKPTAKPTSRPTTKPSSKPTPRPKPTKPVKITPKPSAKPTKPITTKPPTTTTTEASTEADWVEVSVTSHEPSILTTIYLTSESSWGSGRPEVTEPSTLSVTFTTDTPGYTLPSSSTPSHVSSSSSTSGHISSSSSTPNISSISGTASTVSESSTTSSPNDRPPVESNEILNINMTDFRDVCGRRLFPEPRIVGGNKSTFGKWPWQISLRQWRTSTYLHKCGAALLSENWAITAAHCVENVPPSDLLLRLGEYDLSIEDEPYTFQERRVQIVASHPQFDPRTFEYDLALLRFYDPVQFQPNIIPICVPADDTNFVGRTAFVTGWGRLYEDGPLPSILQEVSVPVINNTVCETMYRAAGYIEHIPDIFICAGWKKGGFDSCEGDSGGPMVIERNEDKRWMLAGVISWGIGCAEPNQPGVYTRISHFRHWINQILQF